MCVLDSYVHTYSKGKYKTKQRHISSHNIHFTVWMETLSLTSELQFNRSAHRLRLVIIIITYNNSLMSHFVIIYAHTTGIALETLQEREHLSRMSESSSLRPFVKVWCICCLTIIVQSALHANNRLLYRLKDQIQNCSSQWCPINKLPLPDYSCYYVMNYHLINLKQNKKTSLLIKRNLHDVRISHACMLTDQALGYCSINMISSMESMG